MPCRTREKNDGDTYVICYGGGAGGGGKGKAKSKAKAKSKTLTGPELMAKYGKVKVNEINKTLEANKKGSSASGGMAKLKVNKLLKLQSAGLLGKLSVPPSEGVPPPKKKKAPPKVPEGVPPPKKKRAPPNRPAPKPPQQATNIFGLSPGEDPFPGFARGGGVGQKPPGEKVSKAQFDKARAGMKAIHEGVPPGHTRKKRGSVAILKDYRQKHSYGYPLQFHPPPR
jgi:hypothetical protein